MSNTAMSTEPAVVVGSASAVVTAVIALVVAFGLPLSDEQTAAILGLVAVAAPIIAGIVTRRHVYAPANVPDDDDPEGR